MAQSNSDGDLILSLGFNTKNASASINDLVRQIRTALNSFSGKGVKSAQLQTLEIQARQAIERINELRQRIQSMQTVQPSDEWIEFQQRVSAVGAEIDLLEQKQQELIASGRQGSTEYVQLRQALEDARRQEELLVQESKRLIASGRDVTTQAEQQPQVYERANNQLRQEEVNLARINTQIQRLTTDSQKSTGRISQFFRNMANSASKSYGKVRRESKRTAKETGSGFSQIGMTLKGGLKTLIKYGLGMRSFFFLFRKIRSAVIDSLKELAGYSDDVNKTLSDTKSAATKLKNSIATAIQPIVTVLAPVLTNVANNMASVMNSVAQFFAALTGQSVVYQAVDVQENYADSLDETAQNADKAKKALDRYLSPLDDLNRYSENKTDDDTTDVAPVKFATTTVDSKFKDVANRVKSYFTDIFKPIKKAWQTYGQSVIDSWHRMLKNIKGTIKDIAIAFRNVWLNGTGERVSGNIFKIWKDILDIINAIVETFRKAWNKDALGETVIQSFLDNFSNLLELIHTVASTFREVWENGVGEQVWHNILTIVTNINRIIGGFWSRLKKAWEQNDTGKKIWGEILGLIQDISGWISNITGIIAGWIEQLDFSPLMESLPPLITAFRRLWKVLSDKLKGVFEDVLLPLGKWTIEKGLPKLIEAFTSALDWFSSVIDKIPQEVIDGIASGILAIVGAVIAGKVVYSIASKIAKGISLIASHPALTVILALVGAITGIVVAIKKYNQQKWENSSLKKEADRIQGYTEELQTAASNMQEAVDTVNKNHIEIRADVSQVETLKERLQKIIKDGVISKDEIPEYQTVLSMLHEVDGFDEKWSQLDLSETKTGEIIINTNIDKVNSDLDKLFKKWEKAQYINILQESNKSLAKTLSENRNKAEQGAKDVKSAYSAIEQFIEDTANLSVYTANDLIQMYRNNEIDNWGFWGWNLGFDGDALKELLSVYDDADTALQDYISDQSNAEQQYHKTWEALKFLYGDTKNYAGALYMVEQGFWDEKTAYEALGWSADTTIGVLKSAAQQQQKAQDETTRNAEESSKKQQAANNKTASSAKTTAEKTKNANAGIRESSNKTTKTIKDSSINNANALDSFSTATKTTQEKIKTETEKTGNWFTDLATTIKEKLSIISQAGETAGTDWATKFKTSLENNKTSIWDTITNVLRGELNANITPISSTGNLGLNIGMQAIPKLATGAVLPAGKPFMAMLGDQSNGRNLEAPESLIRKIVREETTNNRTGNVTYTVPVQIGRKTLFTLVLDEAKLKQSQTGYNPFVKMGG